MSVFRGLWSYELVCMLEHVAVGDYKCVIGREGCCVTAERCRYETMCASLFWVG